jgi:hypothetical protein
MTWFGPAILRWIRAMKKSSRKRSGNNACSSRSTKTSANSRSGEVCRTPASSDWSTSARANKALFAKKCWGDTETNWHEERLSLWKLAVYEFDQELPKGPASRQRHRELPAQSKRRQTKGGRPSILRLKGRVV